jgi:hypothetical protein
MLFLMLAFILVSSACAVPPLEGTDGQPSVTLTALEAGPPTATIVWFPATATWTPFPTVEPSLTPQMYPGLGGQVYFDDFSEIKKWSQARDKSSGDNSIILGRNRLTLAVNASPAVLFSLNNDLALSDFYAEISISVNRCFGPDAYGMLFRTSTAAFTYRYLLNCTGKVRVEQTRNSVTLPLQDWVPSGDAPSGAPGQVIMGVWASGAEMRFFLNGRYQFTVVDPLFKHGGLGVYASSFSPEGMNISFSDLTVSSVDYLSPTPSPTSTKTATPTRTPRPTP